MALWKPGLARGKWDRVGSKTAVSRNPKHALRVIDKDSVSSPQAASNGAAVDRQGHCCIIIDLLHAQETCCIFVGSRSTFYRLLSLEQFQDLEIVSLKQALQEARQAAQAAASVQATKSEFIMSFLLQWFQSRWHNPQKVV